MDVGLNASLGLARCRTTHQRPVSQALETVIAQMGMIFNESIVGVIGTRRPVAPRVRLAGLSPGNLLAWRFGNRRDGAHWPGPPAAAQ